MKPTSNFLVTVEQCAIEEISTTKICKTRVNGLSLIWGFHDSEFCCQLWPVMNGNILWGPCTSVTMISKNLPNHFISGNAISAKAQLCCSDYNREIMPFESKVNVF